MTPLRWLPGAAFAALLLSLALSAWRVAAPPVKPAGAPPDAFSAERAFAALERILGGNVPHPLGSPEQRQVRERLEAHLRALGFEVRVQRAAFCGRFGACGTVENVLAERPAPAGPRVLLAAHSDSVPAGPGASDDGMGVATLLEVARALGHRPGRLPVLLLFSDGEEAGLLGAEAFVRDELGRHDLAAVINVEARGTEGPALLFETSGDDAGLVAAFARSSERPISSSLFSAVYARLPNDTDLSVFRRAGIAGVNFANIGGVGRYHTPKDDLRHLSLRTLQHHGDSVLGLARELGSRPNGGRALFFDVLGLGLVHLPLAWSAPLLGLATLLWLLALGLAIRRGARVSRVLQGLAVWPLYLAAASFAAFGLGAGLRALGALGAGWPAHPEATFLSLAALLAALALGALTLFQTTSHELWLATWTVIGLAGWGACAVLPEASFLFSVPWSCAALLGLASLGRARWRSLPILGSAVAGALLWLPVLALAYDALGLAIPALLSACAALGLGGFWPALAELGRRPRRFLLGFCAASTLVCAAAAALAPAYSEESPARASLAFHADTSARRARVLVDASSGPPPRALVEAAHFAPEIVDSAPTSVGWQARALEANAPWVELDAPALEPLGSTGTTRGVRVRSIRGARTLTLHLPPDSGITAVRVDGVAASLRHGARFRSLTLLGVGPDGALLELDGPAELRFTLSDHAPGLPPEAARLSAARPPWAVPSQAGDETVVSRNVVLPR